MVAAIQLDEVCSRDVSREETPFLDGVDRVPRSMKDERRNLDRAQDVADIGLSFEPIECDGGAGLTACRM
jgi:hypothetical protein